jgi:hypothetical protein
MKLRVTDAPAGLVRVQMGEHVRYVRRMGGTAHGNGRLNHDYAGGGGPLCNTDEPVFELDGCQVFIHPYTDRTEVIVVKTILRGRSTVAA